MKNVLQSMFSYMSNPDNFWSSILLIMFYSMACIIIGMATAWIIQMFARMNKEESGSFDDFIEHPSGYVTRRGKIV